jgi:hypothetical protein
MSHHREPSKGGRNATTHEPNANPRRQSTRRGEARANDGMNTVDHKEADNYRQGASSKGDRWQLVAVKKAELERARQTPEDRVHSES